MVLTAKIIDAGASTNGGWNKEQLAILGISWPPVKGWKRRLIGTQISEHQYANFIARRGRKRSGEPRKNFTSPESDSKLLGRLDRRAGDFKCPFPKDSRDAEEWTEGHQEEEESWTP